MEKDKGKQESRIMIQELTGHDSRLKRFITAQEESYPTALAEIRRGRKQSHWMWFIYPQLRGLGRSSTAVYYAIQDLSEARAYLEDSTLGPRLIEISQALLDLDTDDAYAVFGSPDHMKLKSSMTLFAIAQGGGVFEAVLQKYFDGEQDHRTIELLGG
jgi:uncharacterized protein (DUF1810 family)